jgi:uncharacterized glyoxalase superfamily protein PhnB
MPDKVIFNKLNLVVTDMEAAIAFYRRLGLTIPDTAPEWAGQHRSASTSDGIDLDFDSTEFARVWDQGWGESHRMGVIGFGLPSREAVDETYGELTAAGYKSEQPPFDAFWGARYAIVQDPDGNPVGIMSPVDPARRTAAPTP